MRKVFLTLFLLVITGYNAHLLAQQHINGAYPSSIQTLKGGYAKDTYSVYFCGKKVVGAYPSSIQVLGDGYAKDTYSVYFCGEKIVGAYPSSIQILGGGYAKDQNNAYFSR